MKLLHVDCCISQRGAASRTRALAQAFLSAFWETHPQAEVESVSLESMDLKPLLPDFLDRRDALKAKKAFDGPEYDLARQFKEADAVMVAAPFWDLTFPSVLRIYIEYISAIGLTYHYESDGCHGDCKARRLLYLTTGGDAEQADSLGVLYWKQLCVMFGIPRFDYVFADGLDLDPGKAPALLEAACEKARQLARDF